MKTSNPEFIRLSPLDWLKLQLRLKALEGQGTEWSFIFIFKDECKSEYHKNSMNTVVCNIYYKHIDDVLVESLNKEQIFEEYFKGWVDLVKTHIRDIFRVYPILEEFLDLENDVTFEIIRSPISICQITGSKVAWSREFNPQ